MADSASERKSWQQYDLTVLRTVPYDGEGWSGYKNRNDFDADPGCIALWNHESGALQTDSIGNNDWSVDGGAPTANLINYIQGESSVLMNNIPSSDIHKILDSALDSGFPGKSGTANTSLTLCFWVKMLTISPDYRNITFFSKAGGGDFITNYSYTLWISYTPSEWTLRMNLSSDGFNFDQGGGHDSILALNRWYHIAFSVGDGGWRMRIFDNTAEEILGADKTGSGTFAVSTGYLRSYAGYYDYPTSMLLDEMVVWNRVLSVAEIDKVRTGNYVYTP